VPRSELYTTCSIDPAMVVVFKPHGILDADVVDRIGDALKELGEHAHETKFVFDFSRVEYLSSSALGMLIGLQRNFAQKDREMKLVGINDENKEVFRITKLDRVFDIYDDTKAALEAFRKHQ